MPFLMLVSCSDIDGLNDYNAVFDFQITEHRGAEGDIEIGEADMKGNYIHIPVLHGIHNFPLYFKGTPVFENPIDRVTGIDFEDWIVIDFKRDSEGEPVLDDNGSYIFDEPTFYVQALSGLPREYKFVIDYEATSSDTNVYPQVTFNAVSEGTIIASMATVESNDVPEEGDIVRLNVAEPSFPLSVTPLFTISDGATLKGNGTTSYKFTSQEELHSFTVVALDGTERVWKLGLNVLPVVNANSVGYTAAQLEVTDLNDFESEARSNGFFIEEYDFSASVASGGGDQTAGAEMKATAGRTLAVPSVAKATVTPGATAAVADTLNLYISTSDSDPFPLRIGLRLPEYDLVSVVGDIASMEFADMKSVNEFYMLDIGNDLARRWVVALKDYESPIASVISFSYDYTAAEIKTKAGQPYVPSIVMDDDKTVDIDHVNHRIYLRAVEINKPYTSIIGSGGGTWGLELDADIRLSNGASLVGLPFEWTGTDSWKTPKSFGIEASDGTLYEWELVIRDWSNGAPEASDECELTGVTVKQVRPFVAQVDINDPVTIDNENHTVTINLTKDDNAYPLTVAVDYQLSEYAGISTQNNGRDPLVFRTPESEVVVTVVSESGNASQDWVFKLRPPLKESGTDVTSFKVISFSGSGFACEVTDIDTEAAEVHLNFTKVGEFPVTMTMRMGLSYKATSDVTDASGLGTFQFAGIEDKTFTVTSQSGESRVWTLKTSYNYTPQLQNWDFELWENETTPLPKGIKGSPYWASANMTSPIAVTGTSRTDGAPGQGYAVQLQTQSVVGRLAAGSIFLGWFDSSDPLGNMSDPTVMTFQGMPFSASRPIKGLNVDVWYQPGNGAASDAGSVTIELIKIRNAGEELEYHGDRPGEGPHPNNNADRVARGRAIVGLQAGVIDTGDTVTEVVEEGVWKTIFVPLEYSGSYPDYTHLSVICSSSSLGDAFKGVKGSTMKLDNVKLVYE